MSESVKIVLVVVVPMLGVLCNDRFVCCVYRCVYWLCIFVPAGEETWVIIHFWSLLFRVMFPDNCLSWNSYATYNFLAVG